MDLMVGINRSRGGATGGMAVLMITDVEWSEMTFGGFLKIGVGHEG